MIGSVLALLNCVLAAGIAALSWQLRTSSSDSMWLRYLYVFIGLAWMTYYGWVLLFTPTGDNAIIFSRPLFTFTLSVMAAGGIYRWRRDAKK